MLRLTALPAPVNRSAYDRRKGCSEQESLLKISLESEIKGESKTTAPAINNAANSV